MIPVGAGDIPGSGEELSERVTSALYTILQGSGTKRPTATCAMSAPDRVDSVTIDVSQVECGTGKIERPKDFTVLGTAEVQSFIVSGDPALVFGAPVVVKIDSSNIPMAWSRDDRGFLWLVPKESGASGGNASGTVELAAEVAQIERAARSAVTAIADQQGAKLKGLDLKIVPSGPRGLSIRADVAASKFMMTAKVAVTAEAAVDDNMNLRIGRLNVTGDGAAGSMVANMLGDKLRQWEGREVDLGRFVFAGAKLTDVDLQVDERVRLTAKFGNNG